MLGWSGCVYLMVVSDLLLGDVPGFQGMSRGCPWAVLGCPRGCPWVVPEDVPGEMCHFCTIHAGGVLKYMQRAGLAPGKKHILFTDMVSCDVQSQHVAKLC